MMDESRLSPNEIIRGLIKRGKDMYRVLICDDDQNFAEKLSQAVESASQQFNYKLKILFYKYKNKLF